MIRSLQAAAFALIAGCASNPSQVVSPRCDLFDNCFDRTRVRSYEFLDRDTLIVEVGPYRCPFLVEVDGIDCNLAFAGRVAFYDNDRRICALDNAVLATDIFVGSYPQDVCYIRDVRAISEDELLERYATSGRIPPLPPAGSGELEVEEVSESTGSAAANPTDASPATDSVAETEESP